MIVYAADDEKYPLKLLESSIVEAMPGVTPVCFRDAESLLEAAKVSPPDLVFLDIQMPEMDGIELAEHLNALSANVKIVFVTGYSEYANRAFDVYASGYIMKPCTPEKIEKLMQKVLPPKRTEKEIVIKTFGNFDISYRGKSVLFRSGKSKELLAYLVDRNGAHVSRQEAAGVLFEDDFSRVVQSRLSQIASGLADDLESAGVKGLFFSERGYRVDLSVAECDMVEYCSGSPKYPYLDEYMEQYSWGEYRKGAFERLKKTR